jgi:hypothetical protein
MGSPVFCLAGLWPQSSYLLLLSSQEHRHAPWWLACFWDRVSLTFAQGSLKPQSSSYPHLLISEDYSQMPPHLAQVLYVHGRPHSMLFLYFNTAQMRKIYIQIVGYFCYVVFITMSPILGWFFSQSREEIKKK